MKLPRLDHFLAPELYNLQAKVFSCLKDQTRFLKVYNKEDPHTVVEQREKKASQCEED